MRIGQLLEAMKNLFLILLLIQSSSSLQLIKGTNCSDTQLETFQKKLDLSYSHVEHNCHLEVKEKLVQMSENTVSTVKGPLVKYLLEIVINDKEGIGVIVSVDSDSCQQPTGWFDQLDTQWNISQCVQAQHFYLRVDAGSLHKLQLTWIDSLSCNTIFRCSKWTIVAANEVSHVHKREIRSTDSQPNTSPYLLYTDGNLIHQLSLDGSRQRTIVNNPTNRNIAVDYHFRLGQLYWSDQGNKMIKSDLDGSHPITLLDQQSTCRSSYNIYGLAVDWISDKLYYLNSCDRRIEVLDLASYDRMILASDIYTQLYRSNIIVDPTTRWLYWNYDGRLEKISMDGMNRTEILAFDYYQGIVAFTLDYQAQLLYWVLVDHYYYYYTNNVSIYSSTVDGTNIETVFRLNNDFYNNYYYYYGDIHLSLFEQRLFVSSSTELFVLEINEENVTTSTIVDRSLLCNSFYRHYLTIISENKQLQVMNPCGDTKGGCSHFCLLSAVDPRGYSCDCPDGMVLGDDTMNCTYYVNETTTGIILPTLNLTQGSCMAKGYSSCCTNGTCLGSTSECFCDANCHLFEDCCEDLPQDCQEQDLTEYLLITNKNYIHQVDTDHTRSVFRLQTPWSGLNNAISLDYHYRKNHLFWTATYNESLYIWYSNLDDGSYTIPLVDTGASSMQYVDIAVDWITDKIYWTYSNQITVYDLHSGYQTIIINSTELGDSFHQILVDPIARCLYWSNMGHTPTIQRASMDGSGASTVLNITDTFVFTIDYTQQMLYWIIENGFSCSNNEQHIIGYSNVDGSERSQTVVTSNCFLFGYYPRAIDFFGGDLYSFSTNTFNIYKIILGEETIVNTFDDDYISQCPASYTGMKVISDQRQQQGENPCAINNGGCAHLCLLSFSDDRNYTCSCHSGAELHPNNHDCIGGTDSESGSSTTVIGSCSAATCFELESCKGDPPNCYCDGLCHMFKDCCPDVGNKTSTEERPTEIKFMVQPQNLSVNQLEALEIQCSVDSTLIPSFTWNFTKWGSSMPVQIVKENVLLSSDYSFRTVARSTTLIIESAQWVHSGLYTCIASDGIDIIQAEGSLDVFIHPRLHIQGSSNTPNELDTLTLECNVTANPPANITWLFRTTDGVKSVLATSRRDISHQYEANGSNGPVLQSTLVVRDVIQIDSGHYICEASSNTFTEAVSVNFSISVTVHNECRIDNQGNIPCLHNGICYDLLKGYTCSCMGNYQGTNCEEEVPQEEVIPPEIRQPPESTTADLAKAVNLTCTAEGHPAPTYEWYKDGVLIPGETRSILYIAEPLPSDRGNYTCKAINSKGEIISEPAKLDIQGILQYSVQLNIENVNETLEEIMESITSRNLPDSSASVYEVSLLRASSLEATILITVFEQQSTGDPLNLITSTLSLMVQSTRIREGLWSALLSYQTQVITISRFDGCDAETFMGVDWPETNLGVRVDIPCPCAEFAGSLAGRAYRYCGGTYSQGARWEASADITNCTALNSETTRRLCDAARSQNASVASEVAVEVTGKPEQLTSADVSTSISIVVDLLSEEALNNSKVRENYLQTIDNIQQADSEVVLTSQQETQSSSRLLESLQNFLDRVEIMNGTTNQTVFAFKAFALQVQTLDPEEYQGQTFSVDLGSVEEAVMLEQKIDQGNLITGDMVMDAVTGATASIQLPEDILKNLNFCNLTSSVQRLSYSVFLSDTLFQNVNQNHLKIGSIIVAARLKCADNTTLNTSIQTTFQINHKAEDESVNGGACAIWDKDEDEFGAWSTSACKEVERNGNERVCSCTQLAHFGMLFDLNPKAQTSEEAAIALSVITYLGLIGSLLCLTVFVISYFSEKKQRTSIHGKILINLSLALMGVYLFFLIGGHVTTIPLLCGISSALLHYFLLVFFGWTAVEAVWLYLKLVKVLGVQSVTSNYALKTSIPTWVVPLLIVVICAAVGSKYYVSPFYCRATQWPFWFGMILPFLLIYIFNWIMFFLIIMSICCRDLGTDVKDTQSQIKVYKAKFTIAAILAVMFGLGWTLGLAATSIPVKEFSLTFQILFSIFVGAQGVLIFLLHGVRNQDIRKLWKKWFTVLGSKSRLNTILSSFPGSEAGRTGGNSTDLSTLPRKKPPSTPATIIFNKQAVAESNLYESLAPKISSKGKDNTIGDSTDFSTLPRMKDASMSAILCFNNQAAIESNFYESVAVKISFKDEEERLDEEDQFDEKPCEFIDIDGKENA